MAREFSVRQIYSATAAASSSAYSLDFRDDRGETERLVIANVMHASDTITVEGSADNSVWHTLDTLGGATKDFALISGPWPWLRVTKAGTNDIATVLLVG